MKSKGWSMVKRLNPLADRRAEPSPPLQAFNWALADDATAGLALVAATQRLTSAGVDTPKLDSEVLLGYVLGSTRAQLYAYPERLLTADERTRFERMVVRRFHHEPVAYLVGEKAFYGLDFFVDRRVLIPRPETELLVDMVLDVALQYDPAKSNGHKQEAIRVVLADVGAGSGVVSVAALANAPSLYSYAIDISSDALEVARANARRHGLEDRIRFLQSDLLADLPEPVDMVDIFRNSEAAGRVVDEVLALPWLPKTIWMQLSVRNDEAAARAEAKGVQVVMNRCPKIEWGRLSGEISWGGINSRILSSKKPVMMAGFQKLSVENDE